MHPSILFLFFVVVALGTPLTGHINEVLDQSATGIISPSPQTLEIDGEAEEEEDDYEEYIYVKVFRRDQYGKFSITLREEIHVPQNEKSGLQLEKGVNGFPLRNMLCQVSSQTQLQCSWVSVNLSSDAQISFSVNGDEYGNTCLKSGSGNQVHCQAQIINNSHMVVRINMSLPDTWYTYAHEYEKVDIEKLDPPQNITMLIVNGSLHIKWNKPSTINDHCFLYQIRINNNIVVNVSENRNYVGQGVDLTKNHFVQMRVTKSKMCRYNNIWSEWSEVLEVVAPEKLYELHPLVIALIVFCTPMVVLSILLVCRFRLLEMLFAPVPAPSTKIKHLLERDDFIEVMKNICTEEGKDTEDIAVVQFEFGGKTSTGN